MNFERRSGRRERISHGYLMRGVSGRRNIKCKGPKAGAYLTWLKISSKNPIAGEEHIKRASSKETLRAYEPISGRGHDGKDSDDFVAQVRSNFYIKAHWYVSLLGKHHISAVMEGQQVKTWMPRILRCPIVSHSIVGKQIPSFAVLVYCTLRSSLGLMTMPKDLFDVFSLFYQERGEYEVRVTAGSHWDLMPWFWLSISIFFNAMFWWIYIYALLSELSTASGP